jgi:hypothetical protein
MMSRTSLWTPLALSIALLAAACAGGTEVPRATDTGAEPAPESLKGPEDLPEPEVDLTDVIALLREQVEFGMAPDTRYQADVTGVAGIRLETRDSRTSAWFQPAILVGEPGQTLTVVLSNPSADHPHTFTVPDLDIDVYLLIGSEETVQVTFPEDDQPIVFFCRLHRKFGQLGALVASN